MEQGTQASNRTNTLANQRLKKKREHRLLVWYRTVKMYWKIPLPGGGGKEYQPMLFGGKIIRQGREKEGKCKKNGKRG
jgi:hypothetical protein